MWIRRGSVLGAAIKRLQMDFIEKGDCCESHFIEYNCDLAFELVVFGER